MMACLRISAASKYVKTALVVALAILAAGSQATAQTAASLDSAGATYKANCAICHGDDGAGSAIGARLHVKDLRSKEVQDRSAKELEQIVRAGTGNMPAFGSRLDGEQIQKVIEFVRQKAPK